MIAVDSSAIVALILGEAEAETMETVLLSASMRVVGTPTLLETRMVLGSRIGSDRAASALDLIFAADWQIAPFDARHLSVATDAFTRFGRGTGHPARLNFGDCMAYAVAKVADCPLLYKGDDFSRTDIRPAI